MRILLIFIVSIQLISGGSVGVQLSKMGYLFAHMKKFQIIEKGSVVDFIVLHYGSSGHTESSQDHSKLPFHQFGTDFTCVLLLHQAAESFHLSGSAIELNNLVAGKQSCFPNKYLSTLYKPPT